MKKTLTLILVLVLLVSCAFGVFAACEPQEPDNPNPDKPNPDNPNPDNPTPDNPTPAANKKLVFYSSQGTNLTPITDKAIASFQAKYPGWTIDHQAVGSYDNVKEKVIADLQGNQQPDLVYCYADHVAQYLQTKKVVNLNTWINSTEKIKGAGDVEYTIGYSADELKDFLPSYWNEGLATGFGGYADYGYKAEDMLLVPFVKSTELMYYNKTALDNLGLSVATTWEELWAQCDELLSAYPTVTPLAYDSEANWFISMCEQNGWDYTSAENGKHFNFNGEEQKAWLEKLREYYSKSYITTQKIINSYTSNVFKLGENNGGAIYCIGSSGGASHQDPDGLFEVGIAPIPGVIDGEGELNNSVISQGPSLCMLNTNYENAEERQKMTFLFIKEMLDASFQADFCKESGYNSCRYSTYELEKFKEFLSDETNLKAYAVKTAQGLSEKFFTSPAFVGSSDARTQVGNALVYVLTGEKTAEKALKDAYDACGGNK